MFLDQAERGGERPFLWVKRDGRYQPLSWSEVARRVSALTRGLHELGVGAGDRVVIVSENRPEWFIADLAIMAAGGITVPAYTTNTAHDHRHILENSEAKGAIVSTRRLADSFLPVAHRASRLKFVICIEEPRIAQRLSIDVHDWARVLGQHPGTLEETRQRIAALGREDTACLTYTSGTGGAPKGVMIHHGAILHNCAGAIEVVRPLGLDDNVFLSFLPLSHAYEHLGGQFLPLSLGAEIYYAQGVEKLATNMAEARPTIMTVVPRLFELLRARILRGVEQKGGWPEKLFLRALDLGTRRYHDPRALSARERIENLALDALVRRKVRKRFGGRMKALVSGGAPLNPDVGIFFHALGLRLLQGYGQTEAAPVISVNRPDKIKMHTVGPPLKDTEIKIAEDGEVLVRGELVMHGYWRDPETTRHVLRGGWLHTGDVGLIDDDGHLQITDRKKDIIVNDKGENVSPQKIEGLLTLELEIAQAMIYGDGKPHLVALLVPDGDWLKAWAKEHGKPLDLAELTEDADLRAALDAVVTRVNGRLSNIERLRRFIIAGEPFTIENGQMTPTLKIRRHIIIEQYGDRLEALY